MSLKDLNDAGKAKDGTVASVMDYNPVNIVAQGHKRRAITTPPRSAPTTTGPSSMAISPSSIGDAELKKIASRSGEPALQYATDEDTLRDRPRSRQQPLGPWFRPDGIRAGAAPDRSGNDSRPDRSLGQGRGRLLPGPPHVPRFCSTNTADSMYFVSRYVGGLQNVAQPPRRQGRPPADRPGRCAARSATRCRCLEENLFSDKPFQFPPELYNQLGFTNWQHWGMDLPPNYRKDFGMHDFVLRSQNQVLNQFLSATTLRRMHDAELRAGSDADVLTTAELIQRLTKVVFSEVESTKEGDYSLRKPAISSLRRNLQRSYLRQLSTLALGQGVRRKIARRSPTWSWPTSSNG